MQEIKQRSFLERPEGKTGTFFGIAILAALGYGLYTFLPLLITLAANTITLVAMLGVLAAIVYVVLDPKFRNLIWYMYQSVMRWITGIFVQIDPIGIIESYMEDLKNNLQKMAKQIANLKGQMRKLQDVMTENKDTMEKSILLANRAKEKGKDSMMVLKARKAGRLQESNLKLNDLYKKMEVMYRVLTRMYETSQVLLEDITDEVQLKKRESEAIKASHTAMKSAMAIISGDKDRKQMFDQAMEAIADDVGRKVGEMERFMEISESFIDSVDLQNGIYEEKGLEMLEKWEKEGVSFLLGDEKNNILKDINTSNSKTIDLDAPVNTPNKEGRTNQYSDLFNF